MRHRNAMLSLILILLTAVSPAFAAEAPRSAEGIWLGALEVMGTRLRIVFKISKVDDGAWKTTLDSPDQGAKDIPVSETVVSGDSLILRVAAVMGKFEGIVLAGGDTLDGKWTQGGMTFPLRLARAASAPDTRRSQEPVPPYPYVSEDVRFHNATAGIDLAGTFTKPETGGPFTAVVLLTGSGGQDRDETVFGHKPFLVLSDHLTHAGVAVLRFDDRGVARSGGSQQDATSLDFVTDANAAVEYLKSRPDVNPRRIGLIGHSEGGLIAPAAALRSRDVAFQVLLAGPAMRGDSLILIQAEAIMKASGADASTIADYRGVQKRIFDAVESEPDTAAATLKVRALLEGVMAGMTEAEKAQSGLSEQSIPMQIRQVNSPWFRFFLAYDPVPVLAKTKIPTLALWGGNDLQVPPASNRPLMEAAFAKAGNRRAVCRVMPSLNHLFQTCETGAPSEYARIDETFSPVALNAVSEWIAGIK
jgi:uncharacterized protein